LRDGHGDACSGSSQQYRYSVTTHCPAPWNSQARSPKQQAGRMGRRIWCQNQPESRIPGLRLERYKDWQDKLLCLLACLFGTGSCYVAQASLELPIFLPLPSECWDYTRTPLLNLLVLLGAIQEFLV
jgi:hypothetical protein